MSGEGPESIPTSADPRSHRPTKRRALTPSSSQAASVDALFAKPDQTIRIPDASSAALGPRRPPPPEIVTNVQGSSAGAGSGEFHVYKASRRREYERLKEMDAEVKREKDKQDFDTQKELRDRRDDEKTRKNREKRDRMKARKANKTKPPTAAPGAAEVAARGDGLKPRQQTSDGMNDKDDDTEAPKASNGTQASAWVNQSGLVIHDDD